MTNLGALLIESRDREELQEALRWLLTATERGDAVASLYLGGAYEQGRLTLPNKPQPKEAKHYYELGARAGNTEAMVRLGMLLESAEAEKWFRRAAQKGEALGMFYLARLLLYAGGSDRRRYEGYDWLKRAAAEGHAPSMNNLGMLLLGRGVPVPGVETDVKKAALWFRAGARKAHAGAALSIGTLLVEGRGVRRDLDAARAHLRVAARSEDSRIAAPAQRILQRLGQGSKPR
ncbi:MAG: sel1 repeat family protein [Planctomycetes bacterium]|nr:sel1 repeat family protein [Planctomycetota bacterium]